MVENGGIVMRDAEESALAQVFQRDKAYLKSLLEEMSVSADFESVRTALLSLKDDGQVLDVLEEVAKEEGTRELLERLTSLVNTLYSHAKTDLILFECYKRLRLHDKLTSLGVDNLETLKQSTLTKGSEIAAMADQTVNSVSLVEILSRVDHTVQFWTDGLLAVALQASKDEEVVARFRSLAEYNSTNMIQSSTLELADKLLEFVTEEFHHDLLERFNSVEPVDVGEVFEEMVLKATQTRPSEVEMQATYVREYLQSILSWYLPAIKIPTFEGETEGIKYSLGNISLSNFKIPGSSIIISPEPLKADGVLTPRLSFTVANIDCSLEGVEWQAEQLYMPYLADRGLCDASVTDVKLSIAVTCGKAKDENHDLVPALVLTDCRVEVASFELCVKDKGSGLSWLYNTLTALFKTRLREYIVALLQDQVYGGLHDFLESLNNFSRDSWNGLLKDWLYCDFNKLAAANKIVETVLREKKALEGEYTVQFNEEGPIGIRFNKHGDSIVVSGFSEAPVSRRTIDTRARINQGDMLVGYNNLQVGSLPLERVVQRMKCSARPLLLTFRSSRSKDPTLQAQNNVPVAVTFQDQKLRLIIVPSGGDGGPAVVKGFSRDPKSGLPGPAEKCGKITPGMIISGINDRDTSRLSYRDTLDLIKKTGRPITLRFS